MPLPIIDITQDHYFSLIERLKAYVCNLVDTRLAELGTPLDIMLVGVSRGGVLPAVLLDYYLTGKAKEEGLPLTVRSHFPSVSYYDNKPFLSTERDLEKLRESAVSFQSTEEGNGKLVLVVDDLFDTGSTTRLLASSLKTSLQGGTLLEFLVLLRKDSEDYYNAAVTSLREGDTLSAIDVQRYSQESWIRFWYEILKV